MSASVLCNGCGQALAIPAGYPRSKMRCPACGVMCEVPPPRKRPAAPPPKPARSAADAITSDPPPVSEARPPQAASDKRVVVSCANCGERVRVPTSYRKRPARCPLCGETVAKPAPPKAPAPPPEDKELPDRIALPQEPEVESSQEDDGKPYAMTRPVQADCPRCGKTFPAGQTWCDSCGWNRPVEEKPDRFPERFERTWEAGLPFVWRVVLFAAGQALAVVGLVTAVVTDELPMFLFSWFFFTAMLSFLLGTQDRVELVRKKRNTVTLAKVWRVCFVYQQRTVIRWREHESVVTSLSHDATCSDWIFIVVLLPMGLIPAVIWWYLAIHKDSYTVALTQDHGHPATLLYKGWSEAQMRDIAETVSDLTGLPYERG